MPKKGSITYTKPYPTIYNQMEAPPRFKILDFSKFSGNDSTTTIEHVSRYLAQLGPAASADHMKIRLFSLSLTEPAFVWYTTLALGSIITWKQLEEQFHAHFFIGSNEATLTDLANNRQLDGESVSQYIQRFCEIKNRCYLLQLSERNLAELAYNGLAKQIKTIYGPTDFESVDQLVSKVSAYERAHPEFLRNKQKKLVNFVLPKDEGTTEDQDAFLVQWTKASKPLHCQWVRQPDAAAGYDFDVAKTEQIFDLLMKEGHLAPMLGHQAPSAEETRGCKYYKWHNSLDSHTTTDCRTLLSQIQRDIEQGWLFYTRSPVKVDQTPLPAVNMICALALPPNELQPQIDSPEPTTQA